MPISPQIIADKRIETTVNKLCDLIDKKLQESEETPFVFNFLPKTSPEVINAILEIYRNVGWSAAISDGNLILRSPGDEITKEEKPLTPSEKQHTKTKNQIQEELIEDALLSETGRVNLAAAMLEPIQNSLMHQSILRKALMVDMLPLGMPPRYDWNDGLMNCPIYFASDKTVKPYSHNCLDDYVEFESFVPVNTQNVAQKFYTLDKAQILLKENLESQETQALIALLQASVTEHQIIHTYGETIDRALLDSMGSIESHELMATKILLHPKLFRYLHYNPSLKQHIEPTAQKDVIYTGLYGRIYNMDIFISSLLAENEIFILPPSNFTGCLALPDNFLKISPGTRDGEFGYLAKLKCFPVLIHPEAVHKIVVRL